MRGDGRGLGPPELSELVGGVCQDVSGGLTRRGDGWQEADTACGGADTACGVMVGRGGRMHGWRAM